MSGSDGPAAPGLRRELRRRLPEIALSVVEGYARFAQQPPCEDRKEFAAQQAAGRQALAHIDGLLRLLAWAERDAGAQAAGDPAGPGGDDRLDPAERAEFWRRLAAARTDLAEIDRDP